MKKCAFCGMENEENAIQCSECATDLQTCSAPSDGTAKLEFICPSEQELKQDFVTLLRCRTLLEADMIVSQLESAGIPAFIPDQFLMQNVAFNLNTYGFVRVQVAAKDYEGAKAFLQAPQVQS